MKSILYVQNGRGEMEPTQVRSTQGMEIVNANGDVNETSTGFQIAIDTLTYIKKQVTEQKFYQIPITDYVPVAVGDGAFAQNLLTNLTFDAAGDFETGNINTSVSSARMSAVDTAIASKTIPVINWGKAIEYTLFDVNQALMANNWDIIEAKHRARARNWQLGIQTIAFLGARSNPNVTGLLNNPNVTVNTSLITALLSSLNAANFSAFVQALIGQYRAATNYSAFPNMFVIPEDDFLGLTTLTPGTVGTYPYPMIKYLEDAFKAVCGSNFKIVPSAYCVPANNASRTGLNKHCYVLYNKDPESLRMDIPVDYTVTQSNSGDNFHWRDVGYGQYTGVGVYRNLEMIYYQF